MNTNEDNKNDKPNQPAPVSAEALDDNIRAAYIEGYGDAAHDIAEGKSGDLLERGPAAWEMSLARKMLLSKQPAPSVQAAEGAGADTIRLNWLDKATSYEWNSLLSNVNVPIRDTIDAEMGELTAKPEEKREITDKDIERIENIVGIGCGAWDTIDPKKLVAAVLQWKEEIK